jgi:hypothetical protein
MAMPAWPPYLVMQYRCGKVKKNRVYALVSTKSEAKELVISASVKRRRENEFYVVIDGPKSARDPDNTYFVGALCHAGREIVLMEGEEHPILMPVEVARMYEGDESVKFLTQNRQALSAPAQQEEGPQE